MGRCGKEVNLMTSAGRDLFIKNPRPEEEGAVFSCIFEHGSSPGEV